jgi:hypothetical protein
MLEERCLKRQDAVLRGRSETIGERMLRDLDALMVLPPASRSVVRTKRHASSLISARADVGL